jgi:hypothetical protein
MDWVELSVVIDALLAGSVRVGRNQLGRLVLEVNRKSGREFFQLHPQRN